MPRPYPGRLPSRIVSGGGNIVNTLYLLRHQTAHVREAWRSASQGLTESEAFWSPPGSLSPIVAILLHASGLEDRTVQRLVRGTWTVWDAGEWGRRLNVPPPGDLDPRVVSDLTPDLSLVMAYAAQVAASTDAYLASLSEAETQRMVRGHWGPTPVAMLLSSALAGHLLPHMGEVRTIRGVQARSSVTVPSPMGRG
ncbi:MAG: DinB family protein [Dehalococcoidia bacterium]|nr:DinB family protein [Dehalococcoidia bacterium]